MAQTTKDRLVSGRTRPWIENFAVLLICGHRAVMREIDAHGPYRFAFCERCQDVRDFAKRKPSRSCWTGRI
jgi:hypothetical protein